MRPRGRRRAHDVDLAPGAAHRPRRLRPDARPGGRPAPSRLPVGRWRVRPEGGPLRRAPDRRQGGDAARQAGQVGRGPLREHGLDGPRP